MAYTTINKGSSYFNTILYTGTGATRSITGAGFQPDWVWIKERSASASDHNLSDAVRGAGKALFSNTTGAEYDYGTGTGGNLRSFDSDGFSLGTASQTNANGTTYASWNWKANGAGVSNNAGTISSTVSANTTSGFSIVSYTGNGTSGATVGHGLGVAPAFTIVKNRSTGGRNWQGFHQSLGNTKTHLLNSTEVPRTNAVFWNNTSPTSTLITLGNDADVNESGQTFIAYCFAEVKGYSKFGSYTGNGSTDGTFIYTGFKPAYIMIKVTSTADNWNVLDNKRDPENTGSELVLYPDLNNSEGAAVRGDFLSNGFKCRTTNVSVNASGATYIYAAFAENPLVGTNNVPATAR
jgi:hypothetical protein